ncbi:hypothetical protein ACFO3O_12085 [Dokdonia ponticola]|uniref:Uncharacterized protein n=1 Tax=Dokdonia ponticola TaxID=2041041 RepID=A0ABV9HZJ6_9FLAO
MSCKSNETCVKELEKNDYLIIQKCINKVLETKEGISIDSYLVKPYLDQVSFKPYSKEEIEKTFKRLEMSFDEVVSMNEESANCKERYYKDLSSLSSTNSDAVVFSTTRLYGDLIQIKLTSYYGEVDEDKIKNEEKLDINQMYEYLFKVEDENVKILLQSSTFYD